MLRSNFHSGVFDYDEVPGRVRQDISIMCYKTLLGKRSDISPEVLPGDTGLPQLVDV